MNINDFALIAMLGLLGLWIFEASGANIGNLGEEHGHHVLKIRGMGEKTALIRLPPAVARAIDRAVGGREHGPILRNTYGTRMDRHATSRRLKALADGAGIRIARMHPHMFRHTFVTTMLDAGVGLRDVQIAARHADPRTTMRYDRARKNPDPAPQLHPRRLRGIRNLSSRHAELPRCVQRILCNNSLVGSCEMTPRGPAIRERRNHTATTAPVSADKIYYCRNVKRKHIGFTVAVVVSIGLAVSVALLRQTADAAETPPLLASDLVVDESVPEYKLLQDALRIDLDRRAGESQHFALVPKTRPPDLLRMSIGSDGTHSVVDTYQFGQQWLHSLVELAAQPTDTCEGIRDEQSSGMCVRDGSLTRVAPEMPSLRHVTVYFTGNVSTTPKVGDPETDRARTFWTEVEMVPLDEAAWFTDVVTRGRAALQR